MPRPLLASAIKKFQAAGRGLRATSTPTATPTRPPAPRATPSSTAARAMRTPAATPSRPASGSSTLSQLSKAFTPKFVLPEVSLQVRAREGIKATQAAVQTISQARGVSFQEAGAILRTTGAQIQQAKRMRRAILRANPGLSEKEQIRALRGAGLSSLARRSAGKVFVPREIAGFVVLSARKG